MNIIFHHARKIMLALAVSTAMCAPVAAQEISDSHLAAARDAIAAMGATDRFDDILPDAAESLRASLIGNNPDLEQVINDYVTEEAVELTARRVDLENTIAETFARAIREDDLVAIAEFYNTEAGKALLESGPIAAREAERASVIWRAGIERDLAQAVNKRLAENDLRPDAEEAQAPSGN